MSTSSSNDNTSGSNDDSSCDNNHLSQCKRKRKVLLLMTMQAAEYFLKRVVKNPCRTSALLGHDWIQEILNGNDNRCFEQLRMIKPVFLKLCNVLERNYGLKKNKGHDHS